MSHPVKSSAIAFFGLVMLAAIGCSKSPVLDSQTLAAYRTEFTLSDEPDGVLTVADVRQSLLGETGDAHEDHDHDGDGHPDHEAADHDADHAAEDHAAEGHDTSHEGDHDVEHADDHDADHQEHAEHDEHDHDGDGHADHEAEDHEDEGDHDHDGDGHPDHAADDHDHDHDHAHAHETESRDVVMVGHIGGLANPWAGVHPDYPFAKSQAVFFLADPQAIVENEESGHSHAPGEECAFCAAHAADKADMLAMVQFVDKKGNVLQTDVRELFDVKEQDTVVVSGKARVTAGGILVVDAQGLYIRN